MAKDRGYDPSIVDQCLRKVNKPTNKSSLVKESTTNKKEIIVLPYVESSRKMAKHLKHFGFQVVYKPVLKLQFTMVKDKISNQNLWGIYKIPCICDQSYIGQTKRSLKFRIKEHENNVKKCNIEKSSIAEHAWSNNHSFQFSSSELLQKSPDIHQLNFLEAWEIHKNRTKIVNNIEIVPNLSDAWKYVIDKIYK